MSIWVIILKTLSILIAKKNHLPSATLAAFTKPFVFVDSGFVLTIELEKLAKKKGKAYHTIEQLSYLDSKAACCWSVVGNASSSTDRDLM